MHRFASVSSEVQRASHAFTFVASYGLRDDSEIGASVGHLLLEAGRSVHAGLRVTPRAASGNAYSFDVTMKHWRTTPRTSLPSKHVFASTGSVM